MPCQVAIALNSLLSRSTSQNNFCCKIYWLQTSQVIGVTYVTPEFYIRILPHQSSPLIFLLLLRSNILTDVLQKAIHYEMLFHNRTEPFASDINQADETRDESLLNHCFREIIIIPQQMLKYISLSDRVRGLYCKLRT